MAAYVRATAADNDEVLSRGCGATCAWPAARN